MKLPAKLKPSDVRVQIDSREQLPWDLAPLQTEIGTLCSGDYSLVGDGLRDLIRIERKSLVDLIGVVGAGRDRFEREIDRLQAFPVRVLIVEANWSDIDLGDWRGRVTPETVRASLGSWLVRGLNVCLAGDRARAQQIACGLLYRVASHRWRELRTMAASLIPVEGEP